MSGHTKWTRLTVGITIAFVLLSIYAVLSSSYGSSLARFRLPEKPLTISTESYSAPLEGSFTVFNDGGTPVVFRATSSCGCTHLSPNEGVVGPHSEMTVKVGIAVPQFETARRNVLVAFETTDKQHPRSVYSIVASRVSPFTVSPSDINFGPTKQGDARHIALTVRATRSLSVLAESDCPYVTTTVAGSENGTTCVDIDLLDTATVGSLSSYITLTIDERTIRVPVRAVITNGTVISPATVYVSEVDRSDPLERVFTVWNVDRQPLGRLLSVGSVTVEGVAQPITACETVFSRPSIRCVNVSVDPATLRTLDCYAWHFWFDGVATPAVVRVQQATPE